MTLLRQILTERDNATACPIRLGVVGTGVIYHLAAVWMVFGQHAVIDMAILGQYIQHMVLLAGVGGAAVGVKSALRADAGSAP